MIKLMPIKEEYYPTNSPNHIYFTQFKVGFIGISIGMINMANVLPEYKQILRQVKPELAKKYMLIMTIGNHRCWMFYFDDNFKQAEMMYKDCINKLKDGYDYIFTDSSDQENKDIKLSWRGIEFHW